MLKATIYLCLALRATALQEPLPGGAARQWAKQEFSSQNVEGSSFRRMHPKGSIDWLNQANARSRNARNGPSPSRQWTGAEQRSRQPFMGMPYGQVSAVPPNRGPFSGPFVGASPLDAGPFGAAIRPPMPPPMNPPWSYGVAMPHQMVVGRTPAYNPDEQQRAQDVLSDLEAVAAEAAAEAEAARQWAEQEGVYSAQKRAARAAKVDAADGEALEAEVTVEADPLEKERAATAEAKADARKAREWATKEVEAAHVEAQRQRDLAFNLTEALKSAENEKEDILKSSKEEVAAAQAEAKQQLKAAEAAMAEARTWQEVAKAQSDARRQMDAAYSEAVEAKRKAEKLLTDSNASKAKALSDASDARKRAELEAEEAKIRANTAGNQVLELQRELLQLRRAVSTTAASAAKGARSTLEAAESGTVSELDEHLNYLLSKPLTISDDSSPFLPELALEDLNEPARRSSLRTARASSSEKEIKGALQKKKEEQVAAFAERAARLRKELEDLMEPDLIANS